MLSKFIRPAIGALAFGLVALNTGIETTHVRAAGLAGVGVTPTMVRPMEQDMIRNVIQQILQRLRDQIQLKYIGQPRKTETGSIGDAVGH